ncbi:MAG TPA: hypothetical protein PKV80_28500 [Leptospiraceae bacterium]|nr:hypothetical protein [Leptospiraceae bacterium]HNF28439.1 hypothetical protein [Leptospiraceae bacterium]
MKSIIYLTLLYIYFSSGILAEDQGDLRKGKIGVQLNQNMHASKFIFDERGGSRFLRMFWNPSRSLSLFAAVSLRRVHRDSEGDFSCKSVPYVFCAASENEYPSPSAIVLGADYFLFDLPVYTGFRIGREKGFSHRAVLVFLSPDSFVRQGGASIRSDREDQFSFEIPFGFRWVMENGIYMGTEISYMRKLGGGAGNKINALWGGVSAADAGWLLHSAYPDIFKKREEGKDGVYWGIYAGFGF